MKNVLITLLTLLNVLTAQIKYNAINQSGNDHYDHLWFVVRTFICVFWMVHFLSL